MASVAIMRLELSSIEYFYFYEWISCEFFISVLFILLKKSVIGYISVSFLANLYETKRLVGGINNRPPWWVLIGD